MKLVKSLVAAAVLTLSFSAFAADMKNDATMKADASNIDTACATEAKAAGCGSDMVGSGLLKCLHDYKKAHHSFKMSEGCHEAMKQMKADKEAGK